MKLSVLANQSSQRQQMAFRLVLISRSLYHHQKGLLNSQRCMAMSTTESIKVPDGFRLFTENTSHILLSANDAFLNPVQEFNRDLSVACIRTWSEDRNHEKEQTWRKRMQGKMARTSGNKKQKSVLRRFYIYTAQC